MEGEDREFNWKDGKLVQHADLYKLGKDELLEKYLTLQTDLEKVNRDNELFREVLKTSVCELNKLKANNPHIVATEYNKKWSWVNKIVFVLKKIERPLLSSEIIEFITPYEPVLQHSHYKAQAFSAHLSKAVKYNRVVAHKLGGTRGYYYILPRWTDERGEILSEYENKIFFK